MVTHTPSDLTYRSIEPSRENCRKSSRGFAFSSVVSISCKIQILDLNLHAENIKHFYINGLPCFSRLENTENDPGLGSVPLQESGKNQRVLAGKAVTRCPKTVRFPHYRGWIWGPDNGPNYPQKVDMGARGIGRSRSAPLRDIEPEASDSISHVVRGGGYRLGASTSNDYPPITHITQALGSLTKSSFSLLRVRSFAPSHDVEPQAAALIWRAASGNDDPPITRVTPASASDSSTKPSFELLRYPRPSRHEVDKACSNSADVSVFDWRRGAPITRALPALPQRYPAIRAPC